jgi:Peptidase inhibitor family I36
MHTVPTARKTLLALVTLALLAISMFATAPNASANQTDCPTNKVCFWTGETFGGTRVEYSGGASGWHNLPIQAHSGWNHATGKTILINTIEFLPNGNTIWIGGSGFGGSIWIP